MSGLKETLRSLEFSGTGVTRNIAVEGKKLRKNFFSSVWTKIVFPDPGLDASLRAGCDAVKIAARSEA